MGVQFGVLTDTDMGAGGWHLLNGRLKHIAVGGKGRLFGIDLWNRIWTRNGIKGRWIMIPVRLRYIAVNMHNQVTGTNRYGSIYFAISKRAQAKKLKKRIMRARRVNKKIKMRKISRRESLDK